MTVGDLYRVTWQNFQLNGEHRAASLPQLSFLSCFLQRYLCVREWCVCGCVFQRRSKTGRAYDSIIIMPRPRTKWAIFVAFVPPSAVCLSVCRSVAYIANNSRTQRPSVPKFGRKVLHLRCDSHTSFRVKRSKVRVTGSINANTNRAPYILNGPRVQTWYTDGGRRLASATDAMTSKVKVQGHKLTSSVRLISASS